jgi:cytochrome c553
MNKLLTTLFALAVASVTVSSYAQASAPAKAPAAVPAKAAAPAAPAGAKSLEAKTAMCIGCHGIKGYHATFPEVYHVPMISGQSAKYIAAALTAYKNGDRKHPSMRAISASLSEQDINDIAAYYEAHGKEAKALADKPAKEPSPEVAKLLQKGAACISCHGANFAKPIDPSYPKIAGQHPDYLYAALKAYKTEGNATTGRSNPIMAGIAKQYSLKELKALAAYIGSLEGDMKTKPEDRFR